MTAMAKSKKKPVKVAKKAGASSPSKARDKAKKTNRIKEVGKKLLAAAGLSGKAAKGGKKVSSAAPKKSAKAEAKTEKKAAKPETKADKKIQAKSEKLKKKARSFEEEDDFLPEAEEGGEELPDLSDFDEEEEETVAAEEEEAPVSAIESEMPPSSDDDVILTDAEGRRYCKVKDCDQIASVEGYCRYHYLLLWKKIQVRRKILTDGKLERYVEELTSRYPDKFLEMIRRDLKTEKDFLAAIAELEIDEGAMDSEFEDETQSYIDEVRGVTETGISEEEEF